MTDSPMLIQNEQMKDAPLGALQSVPDIVPALTQAVALAAGSPGLWTAPCWIPEVGCFVFSDGKALYVFSDDCLQLWTVAAQYQLNGWTVNGSDLYIQDGCILSQYDLNALIKSSSAMPETAVNFKTHASWSSQTDPQSGYQALFTGCAGNDLLYSAPAILNNSSGNPSFFVLSGTGMVIPFPANLQVDPSRVFQSSYKPDGLDLFLSKNAGGNVLRYLSGGQVVTLNADALAFTSIQAPAGGVALWLKLNRMSAQGQTSITLSPSGLPWTAWASALSNPDESPKQFFGVIDRTALQCGVTALDAGAIGLSSSGGRLTGGAGAPMPLLLSAPCLISEEGALFAYALTAPSFQSTGAAQFQKFKLPDLAASTSGQAAWDLFDSQFQAARHWTAAGGAGTIVPFDDASSIVCLAGTLQASGDSTDSIASSVQTACSQSAGNLITAMKSAGYTLTQSAAALKNACGLSAGAFLSLLQGCGYGLTDIAPLLYSLYGLSGGSLLRFLQGAGFGPNDIALCLKFTGSGAGDIASMIQQTFCSGSNTLGGNAMIIAGALQAAGFSAGDASAGMHSAGVDADTACYGIYNTYHMSVPDLQSTLVNAGYDEMSVESAISSMIR